MLSKTVKEKKNVSDMEDDGDRNGLFIHDDSADTAGFGTAEGIGKEDMEPAYGIPHDVCMYAGRNFFGDRASEYKVL